MKLYQLTYSSRPFGFDAGTLSNIMLQSQENNERDKITGSLICRADIYLQLLEGPLEKIDETYERIKRDDRHLEVRCLTRSPISHRLFEEWAMRDDPVQTWMWTRDELNSGILETLTQDKVIEIFTKLSELVNR